MKVRKFNDIILESDSLYYKINITPYDVPLELFKLEDIDISDSEISMIKDKFDDIFLFGFGSKDVKEFLGNRISYDIQQDIEHHFKKYGDKKYGSIEFLILYLSKNRKEYIDIYRTKDDWFIVVIDVKNSVFTKKEYYRCDQIHGLIKFIEDYKNNNII